MSVQHERPQGLTSRTDDILMAVEHEGLRRIGDTAYARIPDRVAINGVVSYQAVCAVAGKDKATGCGKESSSTRCIVVKTVSPSGIAGFVVDSGQETASRSDADLFFTAQAH